MRSFRDLENELCPGEDKGPISTTTDFTTALRLHGRSRTCPTMLHQRGKRAEETTEEENTMNYKEIIMLIGIVIIMCIFSTKARKKVKNKAKKELKKEIKKRFK